MHVLEEKMLAGIEPDNASAVQGELELLVRGLHDQLVIRPRARAFLNRGARSSRRVHAPRSAADRLKSA